MDLLAILGRGIQRVDPSSDPKDMRSWVLTEDLEVCDKDSAHLPVLVPVDDESPFCMVGGGEMNIEAGYNLIMRFKPRIVVCAYGHRSDYLRSIGAPSESEVMSRALVHDGQVLHGISPWHIPEVVGWQRDRTIPGPSNTGRELKNVLELAIERSLIDVTVVTVGVHMPRTATYVAKHLSVEERYRQLCVTILESEEILLRESEKYRPRVEALRKSKAFARNWSREADGIQKIVCDAYGDAKPKVVAST